MGMFIPTEVKLCPACRARSRVDAATCSNRRCGYVFKGDEQGVAKKEVVVDPPQSQVEVDAEAHLASLRNEAPPSKYSTGELGALLKWCGRGVAVILVGVGLLVFAVDLARRPELPRGPERVLLGILFFGGGGAVLYGVWTVLSRLWDFVRGPKTRTPRDAILTFYKAALLDDHPNFSRAWNLLTPKARNTFKAMDAFGSYWTTAKDNLKTAAPRLLSATLSDAGLAGCLDWQYWHEFELASVSLCGVSDTTRTAAVELKVGQARTGLDPATAGDFEPQRHVIRDGAVVIRQNVPVVRGPDGTWYLGEGALHSADSLSRAR